MNSRGRHRGHLPLPPTKVGRHLPKHPAVSHLSMSPECQDNSLLKRDEQNHELHTPPLNSNFSGYNQKKLQEENTKLKHELEDLRSQYAQLIEEGKSECFDERRVRLLKAQVMQLERQVVLLTEGLSSRAVLMLELKNSLESLSEKLGSLLDFENHSSEVPVARAELTQMIEICQALRNRLQRNHQATGMDNLALSWMISGRNLEKQPMTLIDLCYGKIENVNLRYLGMKDRGHNRDPNQCCVKLKELRQAYQKTREANGGSGSEPQTCRFYDELHAILGGSATTTPAVLFDSFNGDGGNTEAGFGDEEDDGDDDDEVVDSSQQSALEGKLSKLFKHLLAMRQTLSFILAPGQESCEKAHQILPTAFYARFLNHVTRCHQSLEECCSDLLVLTLIVPSAPWVKLEYSLSQEFTVENVLAILPAFPKGAPQQRAKRAAEALVKASNYSRLMAIQQIHALQAELNFHKSLYNLQVKYTEAVFEGIKQAYHTFQENVVSVLCSPLQDVLSSYINLKAEASEVALRDFLTAFKNNAEQIQDAVDTLTPSKNQQHEGDEALSRFGKEFFFSLENSLKDCGEQRDKAVSEMETLQTELALAFENLQSLRKERKKKKTESIPHFTKSEVGESAGGGAASGLDKISKDNPVPDSTPLPPPHSERPLPKHVSAMAEASSNSSSRLQQQSSKGLFIHQKGKSSHRSKSMKTTARPPWQD
ncbi:uncharacterized protein LOC141987949 [Natator depressus]|uniref:uncharacterized protein LOC141987949 n=1 Tax=Natator depressus TaxID=27790 RepID=UPI003EBF5A8C